MVRVRPGSSLAAAAALCVIVTACSKTAQPGPRPSMARPNPSPQEQVTTPAGVSVGGLVGTLPIGCDGKTPSIAARVAFVAQGRAWAVRPDGTGLTCLFDVQDAGAFLWGPRSDRVVVGGLRVLGVGSTASRPATGPDPASLSWGRPKGLAIVFVDPARPKLEKAAVGSAQVSDITPLPARSFADVVYHPSGLALGFVAGTGTGSAIYMSSNAGKDPKRLVFSVAGTEFGPIAFDARGLQLFYAAHLADGSSMLAAYSLLSGTAAEHLWGGAKRILSVLPSREDTDQVLLNVGSGCSDQRALYSPLDGGAGTPLLPGATGPSAAVGWLSRGQVLVAQGGCDEPVSLWVAGVGGGTPVLLAEGVDRASVRVPDPLPTPALPDIGVPAGFA